MSSSPPTVPVLNATQRYWLDHLRACEASGQTMRAYADSQDLSVDSLYSWKQQLRRRGVLGKPPSTAPETNVSLQRLAITPFPEQTHCRIELPNGVVLNWPLGSDPQVLSALVRQLLG